MAQKQAESNNSGLIGTRPYISNRRLVRNTLYNFTGRVLPYFIAIISVPILIRGIGLERFGILTLVWAIIGYFGIFDLGVGRATTKFVSEYHALNKIEAIPPLVWSSLYMLFGLGLIAGLIVYFSAPFLVERVLNISPHLQGEACRALKLLALSIPLVLSSACAIGVLEAQQRFGLINIIRVPASIANFLAPLLVLLYSSNLYPVVASVVVTRLLGCLAFFYFCIYTFPGMNRPKMPHLKRVKELLSFGGWLTVSNIIGPFMAYMDRFLVGGLITMQAVAYYATSYDLITKLWIIPTSLTPVLFPVFSAYAANNCNELAALYRRAIRYTALALAPLIVCTIVLAHPLLNLWISPQFADASSAVLQILALGVLINSIAHVPYNVLQAMNRPDLTAKFHLLELPFYFGAILLLVRPLGIIGVALAWSMRNCIDACLLFYWAHRLMPLKSKTRFYIKFGFVFGLIATFLGICYLTFFADLTTKIIYLPVILLAIAFMAWRYILEDVEKSKLFTAVNKLYAL